MAQTIGTQLHKTIAPRLKEELSYRNIMQVPRIAKVIVNVGYGRHVKDNAHIEAVERTLSAITGQKFVHALSKKSISNFKIRQGMKIGAFVTLRGKRMHAFLYKLVHLVLPRVRDFRGLSPGSFDTNGNYTIGFKENIAFPEVTGEKVDVIHGLEVVIVTTAQSKEEGKALLKAYGFPFREK